MGDEGRGHVHSVSMQNHGEIATDPTELAAAGRWCQREDGRGTENTSGGRTQDRTAAGVVGSIFHLTTTPPTTRRLLEGMRPSIIRLKNKRRRIGWFRGQGSTMIGTEAWCRLAACRTSPGTGITCT